jgi:hypothetical protein
MVVIQLDIFSSRIYKIKIEGISQTGQYLMVFRTKGYDSTIRTTFLLKLLQREFYKFINPILELPDQTRAVRQKILMGNWIDPT